MRAKESGWERHVPNKEGIPEILESVKENKLRKLESEKASGPEDFIISTLKSLAEIIIKPPTKIFNLIFTTGIILVQWPNSEIILLFKKRILI